MAGLFGILHVARSGVIAQQTAVRVASQNITNAEVEGYTRQRATLTTAHTVALPIGVLGSGVRVEQVGRMREPLLDATYRFNAGRSSAMDLRHQLLDRVQQVFGEPSDIGLASSLDAFHASWADLSNQPASATVRNIVAQRGQQLASTLQNYSLRLDEVADFARDRLSGVVADVNRLAKQIGAVNSDLVRAEAGGVEAPDLRDQRDLLIDSLSKLGSVRVVHRERGDTAVIVDGIMLVDGADTHELYVTGTPPEVRAGTRLVRFESQSSTMGELVGLLSKEIPSARQRLDELAAALVEQVNALHSSGYTPAGATGVNFFDPAGITARSISVVVSAADVVSSDTAGQSGNNQIAAALAGLSGIPAHNQIAGGYPAWAAVQNNLGGLSFAEHYRGTVLEIGTMVNDAENYSSIASALTARSENWRSSVSGVSTDEELILVMQHQQAYAAAARLISVVDEMMRTIIDLR